jgi:putative queuosine salvage protein
MDALREACAAVAERARHVRIDGDAIAGYASALAAQATSPSGYDEPRPSSPTREQDIAFWVTLDAINFGSGWFPTLRKRDGRSGYSTIATGVAERFDRHGPWSAQELARIDAAAVANALDQDPEHELMELFARSLSDLGTHLALEHQGQFEGLLAAAGGSAVALAQHLGGWRCFADSSPYEELSIPFLKRAQIAAADLERAGIVRFPDLGRLTMFADNLVPHVLRLDGILRFDPALVSRIERGELIEHDSAEEVEIRACALHAVELIVQRWPAITAASVDQQLWERGQSTRYKSTPRHRSRCTAY